MRKKTGWPFFCKTRFTKNCFVLHLMAFSGVLGEHLPDAKKTIALRNSFVYKKKYKRHLAETVPPPSTARA